MNSHLKKPLREYAASTTGRGASAAGRGASAAGRGASSIVRGGGRGHGGRASLARRGGSSSNRGGRKCSSTAAMRDPMEVTPTPPPPESAQDNYEDEIKMDSSTNASSSTAPPRRSSRLKNKPAPTYAQVAATPDRASSSASPELGSVRKPGYNNISIFDLPDSQWSTSSPPPAILPEAEVCCLCNKLL